MGSSLEVVRPLLLVILALAACDRTGVPPLSPEDAVDCSIAHAAAAVSCDPNTVDPLADPHCGDAMRAVVRSCSPRLGG